MELFTLLVNPAGMDAEQITEAVRDALVEIDLIRDKIELRRVPLTGGTGIVCDISPASVEVAAAARAKAAVPIAAAMIAGYEHGLVGRLIQKELGNGEREGAAAVRSHCEQLLLPDVEGADSFFCRRVEKLAEAIAAYLAEEPFLHVEGFLRFRAMAYMEELQDTVSYAVDEWLMERQYQEFISLLKYFVYIQEAKIPAAHVVHRGNHDFALFDETMRPIDTKQMDQFMVELIDKDINYEDVIVSTLISVSPGKLYIHSRTPEAQVIKTIMTIFDDRAELCEDCHICVPLLEEGRRK